MLLDDSVKTAAPHDSDDWTPPGWGSDEQIAAEAAKFSSWTRTLRTT